MLLSKQDTQIVFVLMQYLSILPGTSWPGLMRVFSAISVLNATCAIYLSDWFITSLFLNTFDSCIHEQYVSNNLEMHGRLCHTLCKKQLRYNDNLPGSKVRSIFTICISFLVVGPPRFRMSSYAMVRNCTPCGATQRFRSTSSSTRST